MAVRSTKEEAIIMSLYHSLQWLMIALLIAIGMPMEVACAASEDEEYVLKFNGSDTYVRVEDDDALRITGDLTLEAYVYWDGSPGYQMIVSKPDTANKTGWAFGIRDGVPEFNGIRIYTDPEDLDFYGSPFREYVITPTSSFTLEPNTWNHILFTTTYTSYMLYHNGRGIGNRVGAEGAFLQSEPTPLLIGRKFESDPGTSFSGYVDYIRIWDTSLTLGTIESWYNKKDVTDHPNRDHLVAYWDFNQRDGNEVVDRSGNGHTGMLMNGAEFINKKELFRIGGLERALAAARRSLSDYPEGVNIGETPKSARKILQSAIDITQDIFDNHEGLTQTEIDQATDNLLNAIDVFLSTVITADNVVHFAGGNGTQADPFLIRTPEQLHQVRGNLSAHFRLMEDIDLAGWSWEPIGTEDRPFTGGMDGNGKIISNLNMHIPDQNNVGLFGVVNGKGVEAYIRNVGLENVTIRGRSSVGALVGRVIRESTGHVEITNSYVAGGSVQGFIDVGGLIGDHGELAALGPYALYTNNVYVRDIVVTASSYVGGLVGNYVGGELSSVYAIGTVQATNDPRFGRSAGGLIGVSGGWEEFHNVNQAYWNSECIDCDFSNTRGEEISLEQFSKRASFGDLWDFGSTWLLYDDYDMLPVLQVFHPLTRLDVVVERSSEAEAGYFFPGETAQIHVTAVHEGFSPFDLTGTDAVSYTFNDVVDVTEEGELTTLRSGEALIQIQVGQTTEEIELTVHQVPPGIPRNFEVPDIPMQGGTEVLLTWDEPENWGIGDERKYILSFYDGTAWSAPIETEHHELGFTLPVDWNTADAKFRIRAATSRGQSADIESESFIIDSRKPEINFSVNGSADWVVSASTEIDLADNLSGIRTDSLHYLWSQVSDVPAASEAWKSFEPGDVFTLEGVSGSWYLHIKAEDVAGNHAYARTEVFHVDGVAPTAPEIVVDRDVSQWLTDAPVQVNITPGDDGEGSGVKDTVYRTRQMPGGWSAWASISGADIMVEQDGITHLEVKSIDAAGNESRVADITIRIDTELPQPPIINLSIEGWSASSVMVTLQERKEALSGLAAIEWSTSADSEEWTTYDPFVPLLIRNEGVTDFYARTVNGAGAISSIAHEVIRIDPGMPNIDLKIVTLGDGADYTSMDWTYQDVQISAEITNEISEITQQEVLINFQSKAYQEPIVLTEEGLYSVQFLAVNEAGSSTRSDLVAIFIDKSIPGSPRITTDADGWTNQPVTVTIQHGMTPGMSGLDGTEYKMGHDGSWNKYNGPFTITEDGEHYIYARTRNGAGATTAEEDWAVAVVRIATMSPAITLEAFTAEDRIYEPNTWTNEAITVTANVYSDAGVPLFVQYAIDSEDTWMDYYEPVTVDESGVSTVRFRVEDEVGNIETADLVLRIDYDGPTISLSQNGNDEVSVK